MITFVPPSDPRPKTQVTIHRKTPLDWVAGTGLDKGIYYILGDIRPCIRSLNERRKMAAGIYELTYHSGAVDVPEKLDEEEKKEDEQPQDTKEADGAAGQGENAPGEGTDGEGQAEDPAGDAAAEVTLEAPSEAPPEVPPEDVSTEDVPAGELTDEVPTDDAVDTQAGDESLEEVESEATIADEEIESHDEHTAPVPGTPEEGSSSPDEEDRGTLA